MKTVRDVVSDQVLEVVDPTNGIGDALSRMETKRISSLLVFQDSLFMGIVTMTDIAKAYTKGVDTVEQIMTPADKVVFVDLDTTMGECQRIMMEHHFHHLVAGTRDSVEGVVSSLDL